MYSLNPRTIIPYYDAERMRKEREIDAMNRSAWLNGLYAAKAMSQVFAKGRYPEKPLEIFNHQEPVEENDERMHPDVARMLAWTVAYNVQSKQESTS